MKGRARRGVKALRPLDPASAGGLAAGTGLAPLLKDGLRNLERFVAPTQRSACLRDFLGTEPGNVNPEPREKLHREGRLPMLKPGERKTYEIEFAALGSIEEIKSVEQEIKALGA